MLIERIESNSVILNTYLIDGIVGTEPHADKLAQHFGNYTVDIYGCQHLSYISMGHRSDVRVMCPYMCQPYCGVAIDGGASAC